MRRGIKPKGRVLIKWSSHFAYALGLLATDGCLYSNDIHICLTSKDLEQINNFSKALKIEGIKIGKSISGHKRSPSYRIQFGDVVFYKFLNSIGIQKAKSKTLGAVRIPEEYFFDFLRGCFDGDGCFYSYLDKRWKSSFMYYLQFASASKKHIEWLRGTLVGSLKVKGHISKKSDKSTYQLRYAKRESLLILEKMYHSENIICLSRKRLKMTKVFDSMGLSVKHISGST